MGSRGNKDRSGGYYSCQKEVSQQYRVISKTWYNLKKGLSMKGSQSQPQTPQAPRPQQSQRQARPQQAPRPQSGVMNQQNQARQQMQGQPQGQPMQARGQGISPSPRQRQQRV